MARGKGFTRPNGEKARFRFATNFGKDMLRAKKRAGLEVGKLIVKERRAELTAVIKSKPDGGDSSRWTGQKKLDGPSRRRLKAVRSVVGRDGTLVAIDHAPMAVIQETGGIIRAKGKMLKISTKHEIDPLYQTFVGKNGLIFKVPKHRKRTVLRNTDGTFMKLPAQKSKPLLVGILLPQVVVPQLRESARMETIASKHLPTYRDLIEKYIVEDAK